MKPAEAPPAPLVPVLALLFALLLAGTGVCAYLVWHHENLLYGDASVELGNCPTTETVNCEAVNSSQYSELFGVPLAAWGMPAYLLLAGALLASRRRPRLLGTVFGIGVLLVLASAGLFYVSKVKIGFLCLWCLRLYGLNLAIPVLAALAARRAPLALLREAVGALVRFPPQTRVLAASFAALLVLTIGGQRGYRASLTRLAKAPAPTSRLAVPAVKIDSQALLAVLPGQGARTRRFDLQAHLGRGKPLAVFFWAPGYPLSETELLKTAAFFRREAPAVELLAVAGRRDDQRVEAIVESFSLLGLSGVPLVIDEKFALSTGLGTTDVPDLALFDGAGQLITAKVKSLKQLVTFGPRQLTGEELVRALAAGQRLAPLGQLPQYFPGSELTGSCAPSFHLPSFATGKDFSFPGKSPTGRPTLLMFWSSTCTHCQREIPSLVRNLAAHPGQYDVVSITQIKKDRPGGFSHRKVTQAYIESAGISWPVLEDAGGAITDKFKVVSTPTTFLIAPSGEIVDAWYFVHADFDQAMERALALLRTRPAACRPAPAQPRPRLDYTLTAGDGREVALSSLTDRPTLVHLWATWCAPCVKELPAFLKFKDRVERDGARVVLVSVEGEGAGGAIATFQQQHGLEFESYRAPRGRIAADVDPAYSVPRTFLLKAGGEVADVRFGDQPWDEPGFEQKIRATLQLPAR